MGKIFDRIQVGLIVLAALFGGLTIGVYTTVAMAGWVGQKPLILAEQAPAWLSTARTLYMATAVGSGLSAIGWVYFDWRYRPDAE